ncbi:esterase-like activity of phytase family protein [Herbidospora cretacea]|uniref:esterase-like activity of phytase family protein n=1 Tax=Herbidospora cretacea TaxID=28444 RepID=UPI00068DAEB7|nr:esterase-like activity of phytase family protein [Herbidospora cretacea]
MRHHLARIALMAMALIGLAPPALAADRPDFRITRFLGEQRLPHLIQVEGTTFGGISGIDRDPATGTWYFISDDRWRYQPARFYTGKLDINKRTGEFRGVSLKSVHTLKRPDGSPYPAYAQPESADPESIRWDPLTRRLVWSSEGDRPDPQNTAIPLSQQFIRWVNRQGEHVRGLQLPGNLLLTDENRGPRRNFGIEGLTLTKRRITAIVEGPRFEDGTPPAVDGGAPARITVWNREGRVRAQYAYPIEKLPAAPIPPTGATDSGVSELLAIDDHRFLALERSWIEGVNYRVRLYEIDLRGATNILHRDSLMTRMFYRPVSKTLVLDINRPEPTQNLESLAWGPRLKTGECTLVIGSDDNFSAEESTQFLLYAAKGCPVAHGRDRQK